MCEPRGGRNACHRDDGDGRSGWDRDQYEVWDSSVYRCYEHMAGPFATRNEANLLAEQFRARERGENPTLWRRRFRVRDIRNRFAGRELLQHSADELVVLLPPEQRRPQE